MTQFLAHLTIFDAIDVAIVALLLIKIFSLIKETRAEQLVKGIMALLILTKLSDLLHLYTMRWILTNVMSYGLLVIIIMFQPELRRALEYIGRSRLFRGSLLSVSDDQLDNVIEALTATATSLSRQKIGALIVLERETGLNEIVDTGTRIDSLVTSDLLISIFFPNTPLHDGAVIIKNDRIKAASCFLPLTENKGLSRDLGTRHRAALGISERSDCLAIVVSEETGGISIATNGTLERHLDEKTLRHRLEQAYTMKKESSGIMEQWRQRHGEEK